MAATEDKSIFSKDSVINVIEEFLVAQTAAEEATIYRNEKEDEFLDILKELDQEVIEANMRLDIATEAVLGGVTEGTLG